MYPGRYSTLREVPGRWPRGHRYTSRTWPGGGLEATGTLLIRLEVGGGLEATGTLLIRWEEGGGLEATGTLLIMARWEVASRPPVPY